MISEPINVPSGKSLSVIAYGGSAILKKVRLPAIFDHVADLADSVEFFDTPGKDEVYLVESETEITMNVQIT